MKGKENRAIARYSLNNKDFLPPNPKRQGGGVDIMKLSFSPFHSWYSGHIKKTFFEKIELENESESKEEGQPNSQERTVRHYQRVEKNITRNAVMEDMVTVLKL